MKINTNTIGKLNIGNLSKDTTFGNRFTNGAVIDADDKLYIGDLFQMDSKTNEGYIYNAKYPNYNIYFNLTITK